jgi:hypothetical protein
MLANFRWSVFHNSSKAQSIQKWNRSKQLRKCVSPLVNTMLEKDKHYPLRCTTYSAFGKLLCTYKMCWKTTEKIIASKNWIKQLHTLTALHFNLCLTTKCSEISFIFAPKDTTMAGGITNIVFTAIHKERSVWGQKSYYEGTSETHLWTGMCIKQHIHTASQQLTYDTLAVRIAVSTHVICVKYNTVCRVVFVLRLIIGNAYQIRPNRSLLLRS